MPQPKEQKQKTAKQLIENRKKRTAGEQLLILDQKLGKGVGAKKERAKLQKEIEAKYKVD